MVLRAYVAVVPLESGDGRSEERCAGDGAVKYGIGPLGLLRAARGNGAGLGRLRPAYGYGSVNKDGRVGGVGAAAQADDLVVLARDVAEGSAREDKGVKRIEAVVVLIMRADQLVAGEGVVGAVGGGLDVKA